VTATIQALVFQRINCSWQFALIRFLRAALKKQAATSEEGLMLFAMNFLGEWRIRLFTSNPVAAPRTAFYMVQVSRREGISQAAKASAKDFYDNSFVESLEKAGFFKALASVK
jgi:hypothetical protein